MQTYKISFDNETAIPGMEIMKIEGGIVAAARYADYRAELQHTTVLAIETVRDGI